MSMMNLADYYDLLEKHDWFYGYSDDHRAWRKGQAEAHQLFAIAKQSPEHDALYKAYSAHIWSGSSNPSLQPIKIDKPPRPS